MTREEAVEEIKRRWIRIAKHQHRAPFAREQFDWVDQSWVCCVGWATGLVGPHIAGQGKSWSEAFANADARFPEDAPDPEQAASQDEE